MNTMLEWLNQPINQPAWLMPTIAATILGIACWAMRVKIASSLLFERVAQVEKQIANLATTCADNTARLAGIEEYLQDKQLAAAMFGKRPDEPCREARLGPGEARRLGNVEFRAGDFPVMLKPIVENGEPARTTPPSLMGGEWDRKALRCATCGIRAQPAAFETNEGTKCPMCGSTEKPAKLLDQKHDESQLDLMLKLQADALVSVRADIEKHKGIYARILNEQVSHKALFAQVLEGCAGHAWRLVEIEKHLGLKTPTPPWKLPKPKVVDSDWILDAVRSGKPVSAHEPAAGVVPLYAKDGCIAPCCDPVRSFFSDELARKHMEHEHPDKKLLGYCSPLDLSYSDSWKVSKPIRFAK